MLNYIVTGAANGIGRAVCIALISKGYQVIAIDMDNNALAELKVSFTNQVIPVCLDLTDYALLAQNLSPLLAQGSLQGVIICHGIAPDNQIEDDLIWDKVIDVNLQASQRLLSYCSKHIMDAGRIVIISSILGKVGKINNSAYCVSKHALLGLTKALALDLATRKITVNAILPSWVDTQMLSQGLKPQAKLLGCPVSLLIKRLEKRIPLKRLVKPEDVANLAMFLISPQAEMITAQGIVIDGGDGCGV